VSARNSTKPQKPEKFSHLGARQRQFSDYRRIASIVNLLGESLQFWIVSRIRDMGAAVGWMNEDAGL